ncbi:hypothetical protein CLV31_10729 [Algoriphagus aquaeductus]|uniref:Uncharacterized protein n=1 Tax=Algoriphagus aquaeductus TaxID=475299 RepID=A0A326RSP1_9BACT|nr:hypothetical protein CLV31_10729 [Algoriphagus aquaeductus]
MKIRLKKEFYFLLKIRFSCHPLFLGKGQPVAVLLYFIAVTCFSRKVEVIKPIIIAGKAGNTPEN